MNKPELLELSRCVCVRLVEEIYPKEREIFDDVWEVLLPLFEKWQGMRSSERRFVGEELSLLTGLGFSDALDWAMPIVNTVVSATMLEVWESGGRFSDPAIRTMVRKYAGRFGAPVKLQELLEDKVPTFCLELYQEMEREKPYEVPAKKKIDICPEKNTLEIGINENGPYVLINGIFCREASKEWIFAPLVLLAAAAKKGMKVNKIMDLLLGTSTTREQFLTKIRDILTDSSFDIGITRENILPSDGIGNVHLQAFEKEFITVAPSICKFESQRMVSAENVAERILRRLEIMEIMKVKKLNPETEALCSSLEYESRLTFKHTRIVMKATKIIGWDFHGEDQAWWKRWDSLLDKCEQIFNFLGRNKAYKEENLYFPHRGSQ